VARELDLTQQAVSERLRTIEGRAGRPKGALGRSHRTRELEDEVELVSTVMQAEPTLTIGPVTAGARA
jgi:hypothetical protein